MELIRDNVKVEWVELGEGFSGDYDPDDPEDVEFLRFDVSVLVDGEWVDPQDASYCTLFPVNESDEVKMKALEFIMDEVYEWASQEHSIKKLCERLSWIEPGWIKK